MRLALALLLLAAPASKYTAGERKAIEAVKDQLKDPHSAQFKGLRISSDGTGCGWVNARNSYGGYAGYSVFYVGRDGKAVLLPPELSEDKLCP